MNSCKHILYILKLSLIVVIFQKNIIVHHNEIEYSICPFDFLQDRQTERILWENHEQSEWVNIQLHVNDTHQCWQIHHSSQNRVLFPGGNTWFNGTNGYAAAGRHVYDIAQHMNDNNQYMPLFGTCLGFELLLYLSAGDREYRGKCLSQRRSLALNFTNGKTGATWITQHKRIN